MRAHKWFQAALAGLIAAGIAGAAVAADVTPPTKVFKSWTLQCVTPAPAAGASTPPKTFCIVHHEILRPDDKTKVLLIASSRYIGKDRRLVMILRLSPASNLQKGVVFGIDKNPAYKVPISSCTQQLCTSRFLVDDTMLKQLRAGTQVNVAFALNNGQQPIKLVLPLDGYPTALDALKKTGF